MGETIDIFRLSGMKYPILILPSTFSTVSDDIDHRKVSQNYRLAFELIRIRVSEIPKSMADFPQAPHNS